MKASRQRCQIHLKDQRKESKKKEESDELIVENKLKTINSECTTLEKDISTFNAQILGKLKPAAKTMLK